MVEPVFPVISISESHRINLQYSSKELFVDALYNGMNEFSEREFYSEQGQKWKFHVEHKGLIFKTKSAMFWDRKRYQFSGRANAHFEIYWAKIVTNYGMPELINAVKMCLRKDVDLLEKFDPEYLTEYRSAISKAKSHSDIVSYLERMFSEVVWQ